MLSFLDDLAGVNMRTVTTVAAALALLIGTGYLLCYVLKVKFRQVAPRLAVSLSLGFAVAAIFFYIGSFDRRLLGLAGLFLKLSGLCGCWILFQESDYFRPFFRKEAWQPFPVFPLILVLFFALFSIPAFQYPASWEECAYQLTVPLRWTLDGGIPRVYQDLPYSGYPLLPQFVWMYLIMSGGGLASVKIIGSIMAICFLSQLYLLVCTRKTRSIAGVFALSILLSPIVTHVFFSGYDEMIQGCFIASALLLVRYGRKTWQTMFLVGVLAGAAGSVRFTGCLLAVAVLLYAIYACNLRRSLDRRLFVAFCGTAVILALLFYSRPWFFTGNPCYPYFGDIFGSPSHAVTYFHFLLDTDRFAQFGVTTFLLLIPGLILPAFSSMFDGSFGFQFFFWLILPLVYIFVRFRKSQNVIVPFGIFIVFLVCWCKISPQLRFLLPALPFLALSLHASASYLSRKKRLPRKIFLTCCVIASVYAFPEGQILSWKTDFRAMISGPEAKRDILYACTGDSMLPLAEQLQKPPLGEIPGKCLLILEERTLYLPQDRCEIGTPFFQGKYFPDGKIPSIDVFRKILLDNNIGMIYLRTPEKNPDYLLRFADFWFNDMQQLLSQLVTDGDFDAFGLPGPAWIYVRKSPPLPLQ